jgi:dienelactone hydrolase
MHALPHRLAGLAAACLALTAAPLLPAMTEQERRDHLAWMQANLPNSNAFNAWLERTGEIPPDFDSFPSNNYLPDPLRFQDGRLVRNAGDWNARRNEIKQLFERWDIGSMPPKARTVRVSPQSETDGDGYRTFVAEIEYGPEESRTTTVTVTLNIPDGAGPFPVLIGGNTAALIRRGYIACSYTGTVDMPGAIASLYPEHDFASMGQVAFTIQTVVDYLLTVPEVDQARIAITGYSRAGKMATIATAWDTRIAAVIAGSTGVGGVTPWRLSGEYGMGEGVESTTRSFPIWFHQRLRFFSGREDSLPVDANLLAALVAPRSLLIQYGLNDEVANTWGNEQAYQSASRVFQLLRQPDRIGLLRVPGFHGSNDVEASLDWLDIQFGRSNATWDNDRLFSWDRAAWLREGGERVDPRRYAVRSSAETLAASSLAEWESRSGEIRTQLNWLLGESPPTYTAPARGGAGRGAIAARGGRAGGRGAAPGPNPGQLRPDVPAWVIQRGGTAFGWTEPGRSLAAMRRVNFGSGVAGDLYYPNNTPEGARLPTVIWLHGYSYPLGYMWVYRTDTHPILALVNAGYAVLAYDQVGFGSRMGDFATFYDRHPRWSLMGRMVEDVRGAIDTLSQDPIVDPERIGLYGYTVGGTVGLFSAALDPRVKAVVSISGFTPMRSDTGADSIVNRLGEERVLLPKLAYFSGSENRIPVDFPEIIASIAPRSVLVVEPTMDRATNPAAVRSAVDQARNMFALHGAAAQLAIQEPVDYTRLTNATQARAIEWMNGILRPAPVSTPAP